LINQAHIQAGYVELHHHDQCLKVDKLSGAQL
jgi:hypothetical protein